MPSEEEENKINQQKFRVYATIFQNFAITGMMLIVWHICLPDDDTMKAFEQDWPEQHNYVKTNLLYYVISVSSWGGSLLVACCLWKPAGFLAIVIACWYVYVVIWNFTQNSVVHDEFWATAAANADPSTKLKGLHATMTTMWWFRVVPCMFCGCFAVCGICCVGAAIFGKK